MSFSVLVWNVQKFRGESQARIDDVVDHIRAADPDIFGIIELEKPAKAVARQLIVEEFTDYDFAITDSKRQIDFLIGWKINTFEQILFTQRRDFQEGNINLRPGGLLSVRLPGEQAFHNVLFLHTDSGKLLEEYKRRQAMFKKIWSLRVALEGLPVQQGVARLVALGDLNTMGRSRTNILPTLKATEEIDKLRADALANGMRVLSKSSSLTYRSAGGSLKGNLDHVLVSSDLDVELWTDPAQEFSPFEVEVTGWNLLGEPERTSFIEDVSDHCALFVEIQ